MSDQFPPQVPSWIAPHHHFTSKALLPQPRIHHSSGWNYWHSTGVAVPCFKVIQNPLGRVSAIHFPNLEIKIHASLYPLNKKAIVIACRPRRGLNTKTGTCTAKLFKYGRSSV